MEKLIVRPPHTPEEARNAPSLSLVYKCPNCKVGHTLRHFSSDKVECTKCEEVYQKP